MCGDIVERLLCHPVQAEREIRPDLIVGTSVGAINGAFVAADPAPSAVERLRGVWEALASQGRGTLPEA